MANYNTLPDMQPLQNRLQMGQAAPLKTSQIVPLSANQSATPTNATGATSGTVQSEGASNSMNQGSGFQNIQSLMDANAGAFAGGKSSSPNGGGTGQRMIHAVGQQAGQDANQFGGKGTLQGDLQTLPGLQGTLNQVYGKGGYYSQGQGLMDAMLTGKYGAGQFGQQVSSYTSTPGLGGEASGGDGSPDPRDFVPPPSHSPGVPKNNPSGRGPDDRPMPGTSGGGPGTQDPWSDIFGRQKYDQAAHSPGYTGQGYK